MCGYFQGLFITYGSQTIYFSFKYCQNYFCELFETVLLYCLMLLCKGFILPLSSFTFHIWESIQITFNEKGILGSLFLLFYM